MRKRNSFDELESVNLRWVFTKQYLRNTQSSVIITDKLKSYGAAKREIMPGVEHRQHKGLNNRAELSHQPTRQKERQMRKFKSPSQAQRFLSVHAHVGNLFRIRHRYETASDYRTARLQTLVTWQDVMWSLSAA